MAQQLWANPWGTMAYGRAEQVAAGSKVILCDFRAPEGGEIVGLSLGLGISDVTQWGPAHFIVRVNGQQAAEFRDQISDLLRPEFMPMPLQPKARIEIEAINGSAAALDFAAIARVEVLRA